MSKKLSAIILACLSMIVISGCSEQAANNDLPPEAVVELAYQAALSNDWETTCLITAPQAQQRFIRQMTASSKAIEKNPGFTGPSLTDNPSCVEAYQWLNKISKKETGATIGDSVKGYKVVSAQINDNKAVVTSFRQLPGSAQKETSDVNLIKINKEWLLNE
jgi:hypothetical protein